MRARSSRRWSPQPALSLVEGLQANIEGPERSRAGASYRLTGARLARLARLDAGRNWAAETPRSAVARPLPSQTARRRRCSSPAWLRGPGRGDRMCLFSGSWLARTSPGRARCPRSRVMAPSALASAAGTSDCAAHRHGRSPLPGAHSVIETSTLVCAPSGRGRGRAFAPSRSRSSSLLSRDDPYPQTPSPASRGRGLSRAGGCELRGNPRGTAALLPGVGLSHAGACELRRNPRGTAALLPGFGLSHAGACELKASAGGRTFHSTPVKHRELEARVER